MPFLLALLFSLPLALWAWGRTGAYAGMWAAGAGFPRAAAVRALLACLACACAAQGAWGAWADAGDPDKYSMAPATVFLVDASASMLVRDVARDTDRLGYALSLAQDWAAAHPGSPAALVAFGATARTFSPHSPSADALAGGVAQARADAPMAGPEFFVGGVLEAARRAGRGGRIILISDGGDPGAEAPGATQAKDALGKYGIRIVAAAVGTRAGGKIPLEIDSAGKARYKRFGGQDVVAGASPERLRSFVLGAGGSWLEKAAGVPAISVPGVPAKATRTGWGALAAALVLASVAPPLGMARGLRPARRA